jgi:hypothetical protein
MTVGTIGRPKVTVLKYEDGCKHKVCPRCKRDLPLVMFAHDKSKSDGVTSFCKECRSQYKKIKRALGHYRNTESLYAKNREKAKDYAKDVVAGLLRNGLKKPSQCQICKVVTTKLEAHHPDYSDPFTFYWLCKDCHAFVHRKDNQSWIPKKW